MRSTRPNVDPSGTFGNPDPEKRNEPVPAPSPIRRWRPGGAEHRRNGRLGGHQRSVAEALQLLKAGSGSHSPSVAEVERAIPGLVNVDACFLSNPYATGEVMRRLRSIAPTVLERMVSLDPSQGGAIASTLAPSVGVPADQLVVAIGACEVIHALLARAPGPLLLSLPTFSAYYEFASGPVVQHQLDPEQDFRLDFDVLERWSSATNPTRS